MPSPAAPPRVEVVPADGALRSFAVNVYPLYLHDLSEWSTHYAVQPDGRFAPWYLDDWLQRDTSSTLALLRNGRPVGFAWVARRGFPFMSPDRDFKLVEFFVLRAHRRRGVASAAAPQVFARSPGRWELTAANPPALVFWERVLDALPVRALERHVDGGETSFRFRHD